MWASRMQRGCAKGVITGPAYPYDVPLNRQNTGATPVPSFGILKFPFRLSPFFLRLSFRVTPRLLPSLIGQFLCKVLFCLSALFIVFFHAALLLWVGSYFQSICCVGLLSGFTTSKTWTPGVDQTHYSTFVASPAKRDATHPEQKSSLCVVRRRPSAASCRRTST